MRGINPDLLTVIYGVIAFASVQLSLALGNIGAQLATLSIGSSPDAHAADLIQKIEARVLFLHQICMAFAIMAALMTFYMMLKSQFRSKTLE
jgi:hypothetical protein